MKVSAVSPVWFPGCSSVLQGTLSNCAVAVPFQVAVNGANLQNVFMLLTLEPLLARSPFLVLHVRRSNLVGDALRELSIHSDIDLKKPLKVSFFIVYF